MIIYDENVCDKIVNVYDDEISMSDLPISDIPILYIRCVDIRYFDMWGLYFDMWGRYFNISGGHFDRYYRDSRYLNRYITTDILWFSQIRHFVVFWIYRDISILQFWLRIDYSFQELTYSIIVSRKCCRMEKCCFIRTYFEFVVLCKGCLV